MTDLVKRLRRYAEIDDHPWVYGEAADRIEKLEAALREIAYTEPEDKYWPGRIARKALEDSQ